MAVRSAVTTMAAATAVLVLAGCNPDSTTSSASASPSVSAIGTAHPGPAAGTATATPPNSPSMSGTPAAGGLPVGPGPQAHYTVQAQPAADSCHYRHEGGQPLPDPRCTPGAISPVVTQADLNSTICKTGYTTTIRPSSYVTSKEKKASAASYGYTGAMGDAEYDHQLSGVAVVMCGI